MTSTVVLDLPARPGHPRNSEGALVALRDGRLLFAYSHYLGTSWQDHAAAVIAARESADGGRTWSAEDRILVANEGDCNVMSVSLLRLHDGRIALFYARKNSAAASATKPCARPSSARSGLTDTPSTAVVRVSITRL